MTSVAPQPNAARSALADDANSARFAFGSWLISAPVDLAAFAGSAVISLILLWVGAANGLLESDVPDWTWMTLILLVDVAHVYATAFRTYFDKNEFFRRPWLFVLTPVLAWLIGATLYSEGDRVFWRALAYLAVFHFVRQQFGWVALYRAKDEKQRAFDRWIDNAAIYAATVYPLIYWHSHLPRHFWWFVDGDFSQLPSSLAKIAAPIYWGSLGAYALRSLYLAVVERRINLGKDLVVATTALCWYLGIIAFNSDYAFTVTNVVIHGVPYLVFVYWYWANRTSTRPAPRMGRWRPVVIFMATVWLFAFVEELLWDRGVWHDRGWLFGAGTDFGNWKTAIVPLLAVPQMTHYLLDGFIWRRRSNPRLSTMIDVEDAHAASPSRPAESPFSA